MKNIIKYSFSVMIMISSVIVLTLFAYKTLIIDGAQDDISSEEQQTQQQTPPEDKPEAPAKKEANFVNADMSYFEDALFIGDSRTMGMWEYGRFEGADFFANTGMSVYNVHDKVVDVNGVGSTGLDNLLTSKKYGKIYLMLGINELRYNMDQTVRTYGELVKWLKEKQPDAIIFIEANMHVSAERHNTDNIFNNTRINDFNRRISELADNKKVFYIDVNEIFDDEAGNLGEEYTSDNTHVLGKYYVTWRDWILTKAIVPEQES